MVGKAAGHNASAVRKQRAVIADAQLSSSSLEPKELLTFRVVFPPQLT